MVALSAVRTKRLAMHSADSHPQTLARRFIGHKAVGRLSTSEEIQALIAVLTSLLGALAATSSTVFSWLIFPLPLRVVGIISALLFLSVLPIYRVVVPHRPQAARFANNLIPAALFTSCGFAAIYAGGSLPLAAIYSPAIPLLSAMICSRRATLLWSGLMALALLIGIVLGPQAMLAEPPPWMALAGGLTVLVPTLLSMLLHRRIWEGALEGEQLAQAELNKQHQEQRALDKRLSEHERSESLSLMAGRIAHDLNNFLTSIAGNASLLRVELEEKNTEAALIYVDALDQAASGAGDLSGQLLNYTGKRHLTLTNVNLKQRLTTAVVLAQASLETGTKIHVDNPEELWIMGDPTQFDQVVVNLVRNADQAYDSGTPEGQHRLVKVQLDSFETRELWVSEIDGRQLAPGRYARLRFRDRGRGIAPHIRSRMFDPFFTDRTDGKGLGMASVAGILEAHGGGLRIESELLQGTEVTVLFPRIEAPRPELTEVGRQAAAENSRPPDAGARDRVLVVDDEETVREVIGRLVIRMGFDPLFAEDGLDALNLLDTGGSWAAVVLDVAMPRLDGFATLAKLRNSQPDLPVVLISGYSNEATSVSALNDPLTAFLQKPFSPSALDRAFTKLGREPRRTSPPRVRGTEPPIP